MDIIIIIISPERREWKSITANWKLSPSSWYWSTVKIRLSVRSTRKRPTKIHTFSAKRARPTELSASSSSMRKMNYCFRRGLTSKSPSQDTGPILAAHTRWTLKTKKTITKVSRRRHCTPLSFVVMWNPRKDKLTQIFHFGFINLSVLPLSMPSCQQNRLRTTSFSSAFSSQLQQMTIIENSFEENFFVLDLTPLFGCFWRHQNRSDEENHVWAQY